MNGTPTSTSRRAIKQPLPKLLLPYFSSISGGSLLILNVSICLVVISETVLSSIL